MDVLRNIANDLEYLLEVDSWNRNIADYTYLQVFFVLTVALDLFFHAVRGFVNWMWPVYEDPEEIEEEEKDTRGFGDNDRIILALEDMNEISANTTHEKDIAFYKTNLPGFLIVARWDDDKADYIPVGAVTRDVPDYDHTRRIYGPDAADHSLSIQSAYDADYRNADPGQPRWFIVGEPRISFPDAIYAARALVDVIDTYRLPGERITPKYEIIIERTLQHEYFAMFDSQYPYEESITVDGPEDV